MESIEPFLPYLVLVTYFLVTGTVMEAANYSLGKPEAGATGARGVWYCWKRVFLVALGALLGLGGAGLGVPGLEQLGGGIGGGVMTGILGAVLASIFYDLVVGSIRAWLQHSAAKK